MIQKIIFFIAALCFSPWQIFCAEEPAKTPSLPSPLTHVASVPEKGPDHFEYAFVKMLLTLAGLLLLVFLTLWALRKLTNGKVGSFGTQKKIKILEKKPLSPKSVLYLVEVDGKQVIISESQFEVRAILNLSELED